MGCAASSLLVVPADDQQNTVVHHMPTVSSHGSSSRVSHSVHNGSGYRKQQMLSCDESAQTRIPSRTCAGDAVRPDVINHNDCDAPHNQRAALCGLFGGNHRRGLVGIDDLVPLHSLDEPLVPCPPSTFSGSSRRSHGRRASVGFDDNQPFSPVVSCDEPHFVPGGSGSSCRRGSTGSATRPPLPTFSPYPIALGNDEDTGTHNHQHHQQRPTATNASIDAPAPVSNEPLFIVLPPIVAAKQFKPRNPLEPDSPISVHQGEVINHMPTPEPNQSPRQALAPKAPESVTTTSRPFVRTIAQHEPFHHQTKPLVASQQRCRPQQQTPSANKSHSAAVSPHPAGFQSTVVAPAAALSSSTSTPRLMRNQPFVPLTLLLSKESTSQQQSFLSFDATSSSVASW